MAIRLNNTSLPELKNTPEVFEILLKYSILNKFGASYTWSSLDDEDFINLRYLQICMSAEESFHKLQQSKANYVTK